MKITRTLGGMRELRLSDDPGRFGFLAETVRAQLNGRWTKRLDELDNSYWDLDVQGVTVTLHRQQYLGVSVLGANDGPSGLLLERLLSNSADFLPPEERAAG